MRVGVLGTMVWDRIEHPDAPTVVRWGGISYSLAAAAAALPGGWTIRPIVKVGQDLVEEARAFLETIPGLEGDRPDGVHGVVVVPQPNNRVHLRYRDREHRHETLTGGVPGWRWDELEPLVEGLDGLYVNLISGFELDVDTALRLRGRFGAPLYVDLHSLLLGVGEGGGRVPRPLSHRDDWLAAFDVVQVNEQEMELVAGDDDPGRVAHDAARSHGVAVLVTRGPAGATWVAPADRPRPWLTGPGAPDSGSVPVDQPWSVGDPTGCGDVWGATCFVALLRGQRLSAAMAAANRAARRNVNHRGAEGLYGQLRDDT